MKAPIQRPSRRLGCPHSILLTWLIATALAFLIVAHIAAAAPALLRTANYESPLRGGPDEPLTLAGTGFDATDRVVYEATDRMADANDHPIAVPTQSSAHEGVARVIEINDPPNAMTVILPQDMEPDRPYRLWVVDGAGRWSQPISINDPRPLWVTPGYLYSTADVAGTGRSLRIVGENLEPAGARSLLVRLSGPSHYLMRATVDAQSGSLQRYVAQVPLPKVLSPGIYVVAVSRDAHTWVPVPSPALHVHVDPPELPRFDVSEPRFGGCKASDGRDDSVCFEHALEAAHEAGGGIVSLPAGKWNLSTAQLPAQQRSEGFILPHNVYLVGAGAATTLVVRHDAISSQAGALLTLIGFNSVRDLAFTDDATFKSLHESRPVIQLGLRQAGGASDSGAVQNVTIQDAAFMRVGRAVVDSGRPIRYLFVTHDQFGGYDNALLLTGGAASPGRPYRIDDSVIRWNEFDPGSYLDIEQRQGTIATQLGASERLDFSNNNANGTSTAGLQQPGDIKGWRAAFFWNLSNNVEQLLVSKNRITCPGDKAGDGEAISLDGNGNTSGFDSTASVTAAGADWVTVKGLFLQHQRGQPVPADFYVGHWISIVAGPGLGQVRMIAAYSQDAAKSTVTIRVSPAWDVVPAGRLNKVIVGLQFWRVYIVANDIEQASPACQKSNLNGPHGGVIGLWGPISDSSIDGNHQMDTDGIEYLQGYSARAASCPACEASAAFVTALMIRDNVVQGEYAWASDCSWSGIRGYFVATPTPEAPPPVLGTGIQIVGNLIVHADGQRGGAIDVARAGAPGPPPGDWALVQNLLIYNNVIRNITGPAPLPLCSEGQRKRVGIRLEGNNNVRDTVLYGNRCEDVDKYLQDQGMRTVKICKAHAKDSCECSTLGSPVPPGAGDAE